MDQKRATLQGLILAVVLSGCSVVVVIGSGSVDFEDHKNKGADIQDDDVFDVDLVP